MTPPPSSSPDNSLPPRHRPPMGNLAKDTTEGDLWDFDDEAAEPKARPAPEPFKPQPIPRQKSGGQAAAPVAAEPLSPLPARPPEGQDSIRVNVSKPKPRAQTGNVAGGAAPGKEFDDLQEWEDAPAVAEIPTMPAPVEEIPPPPEPAAEPEVAPEPPPAPPAAPVALPRLGLSGLERLGLALLAVLLIAGAAVAFVYTIHRLPGEVRGVQAGDFPIEGKHLTVTRAESYWRAPVTTGSDADTVQRGTLLLPEIRLTARGGPAAIRVFFRNDEGQFVGDAVTRAVQGEGELKMASTGGFDDIGMHAAYRAGRTKPWKIEVYEAPSTSSPPDDFVKLFDMEVSTVRR